MDSLQDILLKKDFCRDDIISMLSARGHEQTLLFEKAAEVKKNTIGNFVYFRGLVEFSNVCGKDCLYCGIRSSNEKVQRYNITDEAILEAASFATDNGFASIVLQSGELETSNFTSRVTRLLEKIHKLTQNKLRVTLSCGEQTENVYKDWFNAGAQRYLLRLESSNKKIYEKIHPINELHRFEKRLEALHALRRVGYQVGTGVMIGLPFQTEADLADDLIFMRDFGIDMVGMGPYLEHTETPLYQYRNLLWSLNDRFHMGLKMIAVLRILMPEINIAAATALQAIDKLGREKAIKVGANVIMPNITPGNNRDNYLLYQNKPCTDDSPEDCKNCLEVRVALSGNEIAYNQWGDSRFFQNRLK